MSDVVILHGTMGSPETNWFPWLKSECEAKGHSVYVPKLPTPKNQSKKNWCKALRDQAPDFGKDTILIGHSCGASLIPHVLTMLSEPIKASVFVSTVMGMIDIPDYDALNATFIDFDSVNWTTVKSNAGKVAIFHGDNDPYVPLTHSKDLHRLAGGKMFVLSGAGHINADSGYTQFPEILPLI